MSFELDAESDVVLSGSDKALVKVGETSDQWAARDYFYSTEEATGDLVKVTNPTSVYATAKRFSSKDPNVVWFKDVPTTPGEVKNITSNLDSEKSIAGISNSPKELETILNISSEDKAKGVNVWLDVSKTEASAETLAIVEAVAAGKVGQGYNIELFKKTGNQSGTAVNHLPNGEVEVTIYIPSELKKEGRVFSVVRMHDGTPKYLGGTMSEDGNKISFNTDEFSYYALCYNTSVPATADTNSMVGLVALLIISSMGIVILKKKVFSI